MPKATSNDYRAGWTDATIIMDTTIELMPPTPGVDAETFAKVIRAVQSLIRQNRAPHYSR